MPLTQGKIERECRYLAINKPFTMLTIGKKYQVRVSTSYYHLVATFPTLPLGTRPSRIEVDVYDHLDGNYYMIDILSDVDNIYEKKAIIEETENGLEVFVQVKNLKLYSPIGAILL